jgi:hypothetical protein
MRWTYARSFYTCMFYTNKFSMHIILAIWYTHYKRIWLVHELWTYYIREKTVFHRWKCRYPGWVGRSCSISGTGRVTLVTNLVMSHGCMNEEWIRMSLPQVEHMHCHLWHIYLVSLMQIMVAKLAKWWLQLKNLCNKQYNIHISENIPRNESYVLN